MTVRSRIAALVAEFLGTAILATVAINISRSQIGIGYFVAIGVGLTMGLLVLALGPFSGGHFNPAITIGMWTMRKIGIVMALGYLLVQMAAGAAAWQLANYFVGNELQSIAGKSFSVKVLIAEAVGTFVFAFVIAAAVYSRNAGAKAAALIGGGLFMGTVVASLASNAILNPAIALANQSWSLAYVFGPIIGAVVGMQLYVLVFADREALRFPGMRSTPAVATATPAPRATVVTATTRKPAAAKKKPAAAKKRK